MAKLKVYRTPIGFHDAYVAAPSQKAALAAWGTKTDLFARGVAELVTDEALTAEPLAKAGEVIRRSRGTAAEQLAALPPDKPRAGATSEAPASRERKAPPAKKPTRDALDKAEVAVTQAEEQHSAALAKLDERQRALDAERRKLEQQHTAEAERLEQQVEDERTAYELKLAEWRAA